MLLSPAFAAGAATPYVHDGAAEEAAQDPLASWFGRVRVALPGEH